VDEVADDACCLLLGVAVGGEEVEGLGLVVDADQRAAASAVRGALGRVAHRGQGAEQERDHHDERQEQHEQSAAHEGQNLAVTHGLLLAVG
jgi:hypothetical protein